MNLDVSETVRKDRHTGVNWVADLAADVFKSARPSFVRLSPRGLAAKKWEPRNWFVIESKVIS